MWMTLAIRMRYMYTHARYCYNEVRNTVADWMSEVCSDVCIEPTLQPITGETLTGTSAISGDGARLDVAANGFWGGRFERAYFDIRISTHMPLPTANNASPQPTENMRGLRSGLMNNASGKWSMALLLPSSCHSLAGVAMQQIFATRGSHPCSQRNATNPTASRWPGCDASSPSPCCVLQSHAYADPLCSWPRT